MLPRLLARDDHYKLGYLPPNHPLVQLRHDLLNVGFDLVVGRDLDGSVYTSIVRIIDKRRGTNRAC